MTVIIAETQNKDIVVRHPLTDEVMARFTGNTPYARTMAALSAVELGFMHGRRIAIDPDFRGKESMRNHLKRAARTLDLEFMAQEIE